MLNCHIWILITPPFRIKITLKPLYNHRPTIIKDSKPCKQRLSPHSGKARPLLLPRCPAHTGGEAGAIEATKDTISRSSISISSTDNQAVAREDRECWSTPRLLESRDAASLLQRWICLHRWKIVAIIPTDNNLPAWDRSQNDFKSIIYREKRRFCQKFLYLCEMIGIWIWNAATNTRKTCFGFSHLIISNTSSRNAFTLLSGRVLDQGKEEENAPGGKSHLGFQGWSEMMSYLVFFSHFWLNCSRGTRLVLRRGTLSITSCQFLSHLPNCFVISSHVPNTT